MVEKELEKNPTALMRAPQIVTIRHPNFWINGPATIPEIKHYNSVDNYIDIFIVHKWPVADPGFGEKWGHKYVLPSNV